MGVKLNGTYSEGEATEHLLSWALGRSAERSSYISSIVHAKKRLLANLCNTLNPFECGKPPSRNLVGAELARDVTRLH